MICICFAMDKEAAPLLKASTVKEEKRSGFAKLYLCSLFGKDFLILVSGIGKGFACAGATAAILLYHPSALVNAGIAGSLNGKKAPLLSAVVSSGLIQHDMDTSLLGDPKGMLSGINRVELPSDESLRSELQKAAFACGIPCAEGLIASGDAFLSPGDERKKAVIETFHPLVVDMESACFAQVAFVYGIPYCSLRVISDYEHPEYEYAQNALKASERVNSILKEYLKGECA